VSLVARTLVYASLFVGVLLVFLPARLLVGSGIPVPAHFGMHQALGVLVAGAGATLAAACIATFVVVGRGTPAPFDPPRRLVVRGPYRRVRNPMYVGATAALVGAALCYDSLPLLAYAGGFVAAMHAFVVLYEEPTLRRTFGAEYGEYCRRTGRWWPRPDATR
jgi:protein-S-isoprenylcysteine O-methyltransferase Ste14